MFYGQANKNQLYRFSLLFHELLIITVIIPVLPVHRAEEANTVRTYLSVRLRLLLTRCLAAWDMLACKKNRVLKNSGCDI